MTHNSMEEELWTSQSLGAFGIDFCGHELSLCVETLSNLHLLEDLGVSTLWFWCISLVP